MWIQCLIERSDGSDTFVDYPGVRYIFTKNHAGHRVCFVGQELHQGRLLGMGPGAYREYHADPNMPGQPGAIPQPQGKHAKREEPQAYHPPKNEPLPDAQTLDQNLQVQPDDEPKEVTWADAAVKNKIKEFKFLTNDDFIAFIDANRPQVMSWPREVRVELAKKLDKKLPDMDPWINGFVIDDYLG
jgi:hypothetical protein